MKENLIEYEGKYYRVQGKGKDNSRGIVQIWESEDQKKWSCINVLTAEAFADRVWEHPDLFELNGQWILIVSIRGVAQETYHYQNEYTCGYFPVYGDFRKNAVLGRFRELDYGFDFYAPRTYLDGSRRIMFAWMEMPGGRDMKIR